MPLVAIDIGHGQDSPNGVPEMSEYEFNQAVVKYLIPLLDLNNICYILTQDFNSNANELQTRTEIANNSGADIFVSIHADWNSVNTVRGYWIFHWYNSGQGKKLAEIWFENANKILPIPARRIVESKPGKWANFYVIRNTTMPAILIEHGFMSNIEDLSYLLCENYRKKCALVLAKSICSYFEIPFKETGKKTLRRVIVDGKQLGAFETDKYLIDYVNDLIKEKQFPIEIEEIEI